MAARVQSDSAFARALQGEAITLLINGEPELTKLMLRDLVNAAIGLDMSLHRMLSQSGNPTMSNISAVFAAIKRALKVEVHAQVVVA